MAPKKNTSTGTAALPASSFTSSKNSSARTFKPTESKQKKPEHDEEEEIDVRPYSKLYREASKKMGPPGACSPCQLLAFANKLHLVHGEKFSNIHVILRCVQVRA